MKILKIIIITMAIVVLGVMIYPFENLTIIKSVEILNEGKIVHLGEILKYKYSYHKKIGIPGELQKFLVEIRTGETVILSSFIGNIPSGDHEVVGEVRIPYTTDILGNAVILFKYQYDYFGGLRTSYGSFKSEVFEIKRNR